MGLTIADELKSTLLGLWLGAALFFSTVVAPAVFGVLRQFNLGNANEMAGAVVTRTLAVINVTGFLIGLMVLLATLIWKKTGGLGFAIEFISVAALTITTAVGHWMVAARMVALRTAMAVPIDRVPIADPRRQAFNTLHGYSVALLGAAMIGAMIAIGAIVLGRRRRREPATGKG